MLLTPVVGCQQHPGAEGCEGHLFQPTVPTAVTVQLAQVAAQVTAKLPAARLGDAHRTQRSAVLHRPQQQNHHLGERSEVQEAGTESMLHQGIFSLLIKNQCVVSLSVNSFGTDASLAAF